MSSWLVKILLVRDATNQRRQAIRSRDNDSPKTEKYKPERLQSKLINFCEDALDETFASGSLVIGKIAGIDDIACHRRHRKAKSICF